MQLVSYISKNILIFKIYKMKKYAIIILIFGTNLASCQKTQPEKMIEQFVIDLFDDEIQPQKIVDSYLEIKPDNENSLSISEGKKGALGIIDKARNGESKELGWLVPNYEIKNIQKPQIFSLKKYGDLDTLGIKFYTKYIDNIYVLLDSEKKKILQYFLLNETNNKIVSFSLFIKSDQAWFFVY
ncbi:MAG: hypothetical protein KDC97_06235 [Confluentibacter sp.]|nr:hypothetical protein [Confluentibacter sp.]